MTPNNYLQSKSLRGPPGSDPGGGDVRASVNAAGVLHILRGPRLSQGEGPGSAEGDTFQMMMPSMSSATEHTTARTHVLLRDFCCSRRQEEMMSEDLLLPAQAAATHLVVGRPLELLCASLHVNFSAFHVCLDAICTSRAECVSWEKIEGQARQKQVHTGLSRSQEQPSLLNPLTI